MRGETADRVISCVEALIEHPEPISATAHLRGQLGMDSLDYCDLAIELEGTFGISISATESDQWETVHDVIATVEQKEKTQCL